MDFPASPPPIIGFACSSLSQRAGQSRRDAAGNTKSADSLQAAFRNSSPRASSDSCWKPLGE